MLERATERATERAADAEPPAGTVLPGRFARDPDEFAVDREVAR